MLQVACLVFEPITIDLGAEFGMLPGIAFEGLDCDVFGVGAPIFGFAVTEPERVVPELAFCGA
jgi:hypothetical protein